MRIPMVLLSLVMVAVVLACSKGDKGEVAGGNHGNDAGTASTDGDVADFVAACTASSNLPGPTCECAGRKAKAQLSAKGYEFLVASLRNDAERTTQLRGELTVEEAMTAGTFMVRGPAECARERAGTPDSM